MILTPADRLINQITSFFRFPYVKGLLLLIMVLIAMVWANSPYHESYEHIFHLDFTIGFEGLALTKPVNIWINDGLMAVFFFLVGLEIKKEMIDGQLSTLPQAFLPVLAAIGGMVIPALIYIGFNYGTEAQTAWGIPMATDIAFAIGLLSLVGSAASPKIKVFLTALATADDLGAILVITIFLTPFIDVESLIAGGIYLGIMTMANYLGVRNSWFYTIIGIFGLWVALLLSGIHATLAGVLGAFTIPARRKTTEMEYQEKLTIWVDEFHSSTDSDSMYLLNSHQEQIITKIIVESGRASTPLQRIIYKIRPFVEFFILPLFALANAGVRIEGKYLEMVTHPVSLGIIVGLVVGKLLGITAFSYLGVKLRKSSLSDDTDWNQIIGAGLFAGIGFTMSLFIAELAIKDEATLAIAKVGILTASVLAAILGLLWFWIMKKKVFIKSAHKQ